MNELEDFARARLNIDGIQYLPINYKNNDFSELAIIKGEKPYKGDLIIPDVIEGTRGTYIVTAIYERAFEHCEDLNSVILPKELQFIGKRAFYKCPNLKTVVINSKLKEIQNEAFMDCVQLSDIVTPQAADGGIEKLGKDVLTGTAFWNEQADGIIYFYHALVGYKGHKPRKIEIKEGTTCIGDFALFEIGYLKELVFPNSLRTIGAMSCNRNHIKKLIIPEGVKDIGYFAFDRCHDLEFLSLPSTLTSLNVASFFDCCTNFRLGRKS